MALVTRLIPAKNAMIVWKPRKRQVDFELKVYFKDLLNPSKEKDPYENWPCSSGCCYSDWASKSEAEMFGQCMLILLRENVSNKNKLKDAIFEFGKIRELTQMRMLYWQLYYQEKMPFEGLETSFYAWDFCDGK